MSATSPPLGSQGYFEEIHEVTPDPFGLLERAYERRKRSLALALLGRPRYHRAFEVGCSMGALTAELAGRCDIVVAFDRAEAAITRARHYLAPARNVRLEVGRVPDDWPEGSFDLIILSEVGYYLESLELARVLERAGRSLSPGGHVLAVHWRRPIENCELTGDDVHEQIRSADGLVPLARYEEDLFVAELFEHLPGFGLPAPIGDS